MRDLKKWPSNLFWNAGLFFFLKMLLLPDGWEGLVHECSWNIPLPCVLSYLSPAEGLTGVYLLKIFIKMDKITHLSSTVMHEMRRQRQIHEAGGRRLGVKWNSTKSSLFPRFRTYRYECNVYYSVLGCAERPWGRAIGVSALPARSLICAAFERHYFSLQHTFLHFTPPLSLRPKYTNTWMSTGNSEL